MLPLLYFGGFLISLSVGQNFPGSMLLEGPNWRKDPFIRPKLVEVGEKPEEEKNVQVPNVGEDREVEKVEPEEEFDKIPVDIPKVPQVANIVPEVSIEDTDSAIDEQPVGLDQNFLPDLPDLPDSINGLTLPPLFPDSGNTSSPGGGGPFAGQLRCQDPDTHEFIPTALACQDTRGHLLCTQIFSPPDPKSGKRDPKCNQKGFEDIATTCRKTCGICCEDINYSCEDDTSGIIDCSKQVDKCSNPKWFNALSRYCAGTCGLCAKTSCRDNQPDCRILKGVCNITEHQDQMKKDCARTCGFCSPEDAVPLEPGTGPSPGSGGGNSGPSPPGPQAECLDRNPRCAVWLTRGFCDNRFYTLQYRIEQCGKSCDLC